MQSIDEIFREPERIMIEQYVLPFLALTVIVSAVLVIIFAPNHQDIDVRIDGVNRQEIVSRW